MDILKDILATKGGELLGTLQSQGFGAEQAQTFLGESGERILDTLKSGQVNLGQGDVQQQANAVIGKLDIAALAAKVGISSDMARQGLTSIVPMILSTLKDKVGDSAGLMALLGDKQGMGGVMDMAKGLFKR